MNTIVAGLASLLQIKSILKIYDGNPSAKRVRTEEKALLRLIQLMEDLGPLEHLSLVHTSAPEKAEKLRQRALHLFPENSTPLFVGVTPVPARILGPVWLAL